MNERDEHGRRMMQPGGCSGRRSPRFSSCRERLGFSFPGCFVRAARRRNPIGLLPLAIGIVLLLWCVRDFYVVGRGSLAPWAPPKNLVTIGLYRVTRNPMYVAVLTILCGMGTVLRFANAVDVRRLRRDRVPSSRRLRRGAVARQDSRRGVDGVPRESAALARLASHGEALIVRPVRAAS